VLDNTRPAPPTSQHATPNPATPGGVAAEGEEPEEVIDVFLEKKDGSLGLHVSVR